MRYADRFTGSGPFRRRFLPERHERDSQCWPIDRIGHRGDIEVSASGAQAADGERDITASSRAVHAVM
jgi:hypothetical protein